MQNNIINGNRTEFFPVFDEDKQRTFKKRKTYYNIQKS
jgi:hypothetical protein